MDSKIPPHEIDGSIYYKFETYNGFDRLSVSGFIFHSYSWIYFKIWNWNHGFIFHYSHALPLLDSYLALFWSIQILFVSLTHHKNLRSQGKNEQRNREENQQSFQKTSRTLLANKPFAGNAGINLTGYHPPGTPGLLHQKVCPAPGLLHNRKCPGGGSINDDVPEAGYLHQLAFKHENC